MKKQALLDSALTLFVEHGFHATSTFSIAKTAGVATGTLFHHFASKDELLKCLFLSIKQDFSDHVQAQIHPTGQLKSDIQLLWQIAIEWALTNPTKQTFIQQYSYSSTISNQTKQFVWTDILNFMSELIIEGQKTNVIKNHPIPLLLENSHGQYLAATRFFLDCPEHWQNNTYRQASFSLFWDAIKVS